MPGAADDVIMNANSGGGKVTLGYDPTVTSITMGAFTGELDFSTHSPTLVTFSNTGTGIRTLTMTNMGTMTLTGSGTTIFNQGTVTNLTFNKGGIINCTYAGATGTRTITNNVATPLNTLKVSAGSDALTATVFCTDLDFTGYTGAWSFAASTVLGSVVLGTGMTIVSGTGALTLGATSAKTFTSNSVQINHPITINGVSGTVTLQDNLDMDGASARTLTLTNGTFNANNKNVTCGIFSSSNSNVRTLTMGSGTWTLTGSEATIWTTSTTTNLTLNATGSTMDFTYSGSTGTRAIILGLNALTYDNTIKISAGSDTISLTTTNITYYNLNFTGFTGTTGFGSGVCKGNMILNTGMTVSTNANAINFGATSGTQTLTSNGVSIARPITVNGVGGTLQLVDNLVTTNVLTLTNGTLDANNKNITAGSFDSSNSNVRTLTMGSGDWNLTGTGTVWNTSTSTNLTLNKGTATIRVLEDSYTNKTLTGGNTNYYKLFVRGPNQAVTLTDITFDIYFADSPVLNSVYPKELSKDVGDEPIQNAPAAYKSFKMYNSTNQAVSSVLTLEAGVTTLEVGAFGGQGAVIRWIPKTETDAVTPFASVIASGTTANFDNYIPPSQYRRFAIPRESSGITLDTSTGINRGTYGRVAIINAGIVASSILVAQY